MSALPPRTLINMANSAEPLARLSLLKLLTYRLHHFIDLALRCETCLDCSLSELDQSITEVGLSLYCEVRAKEYLWQLNLVSGVLRDLNLINIKQSTKRNIFK